jgi:phenylalanine-4-hydroxylase
VILDAKFDSCQTKSRTDGRSRKEKRFHQQEIWRELLTQREKSSEKITPNIFIFYLQSKRIADDRKIELLKHIEPATKKSTYKIIQI